MFAIAAILIGMFCHKPIMIMGGMFLIFVLGE